MSGRSIDWRVVWIAAAVALLPAGVIVWFLAPFLGAAPPPPPDPNDYMIVRSIRVWNAKKGEPIQIFIDRTMVKDFDGRWIAEVSLIVPGGKEFKCASGGVANYEVGDIPGTTLDWLLFPVKCNLDVGGPYRAFVKYTKPQLGPEEFSIPVTTNEFWVLPPT